MPRSKISQLPTAGALTGAELVEIVQSDANKKTTTQDIANLGGGGGSDGAQAANTVKSGPTSGAAAIPTYRALVVNDLPVVTGVTLTGANTKTGTASPAPLSYAVNQYYLVYNSTVNTGAVTVNLNGLGAKDLTKNGTTALVSGDMPPGFYMIAYDGTRFQIEGQLGWKTSGNTTLTGSSLLVDHSNLELNFGDTAFNAANGPFKWTAVNIQNNGDFGCGLFSVNSSPTPTGYSGVYTSNPTSDDGAGVHLVALSPTQGDVELFLSPSGVEFDDQRIAGLKRGIEVSDSTLGSDFTDKTITHRLYNDKRHRRVLYKNNVSSSLTGTTSETIVGSFEVPAGTLGANDILNIVLVTTKSGAAGGLTTRIKANTTAALPGTTISTFASASNVLWGKIIREMVFKNSLSSQFVFPATTSGTLDLGTSATAGTLLSIDFSVTQHIIVSFELASAADTGTLNSWYVEIIRNS